MVSYNIELKPKEIKEDWRNIDDKRLITYIRVYE
jgi:hypothetical protein